MKNNIRNEQEVLRKKFNNEQRTYRNSILEQEEKENREKILAILEELRQCAGHELINKLFLANKKLRDFGKFFPISLLYRYSLRHELKNNIEYIKLSAHELAKHENISVRSAFRARKQIYEKKNLL
jgi:thioredoxin-related protein